LDRGNEYVICRIAPKSFFRNTPPFILTTDEGQDGAYAILPAYKSGPND
jgi:hypothetical protein